MDDPVALDTPPRRSRIAPLAIVVLLAFVIGVALMWLAMRDGARWLPKDGAPTDAPSPAPSPLPVIAAAPPPTTATAAAIDPLTLSTRESALAAQIAALEARAATISSDAQTAGDQAGRAEAILIAFAARRALDRGVGLGYLEEQLRQRFGRTQPQATYTVIEASRDPVTLEALRQALDANAAVLLSGTGGGWFDGLTRELRSLVILHDASAPSPLPADRLARARRMLDARQVEPALAEIGRLPGAAQATNWITAARRYIDARKALDALEGAAIVGSVQNGTAAAPTG